MFGEVWAVISLPPYIEVHHGDAAAASLSAVDTVVSFRWSMNLDDVRRSP